MQSDNTIGICAAHTKKPNTISSPPHPLIHSGKPPISIKSLFLIAIECDITMLGKSQNPIVIDFLIPIFLNIFVFSTIEIVSPHLHPLSLPPTFKTVRSTNFSSITVLILQSSTVSGQIHFDDFGISS